MRFEQFFLKMNWWIILALWLHDTHQQVRFLLKMKWWIISFAYYVHVRPHHRVRFEQFFLQMGAIQVIQISIILLVYTCLGCVCMFPCLCTLQPCVLEPLREP